VTYAPFLDWMKAAGITLIVYGHVTGAWPLVALPPIYSKQLGVALFLFALGYVLAGERRDPWQVVVRRLRPLYAWGLGLAVVLSVVEYAARGRILKSNYAPFLGGANLLILDGLPANPTTWYVGAYLHALLLWALLFHRVRVTLPVLALAVAAEVVVRAVLWDTAGGFLAYMALTNWAGALLLGAWYGQRGPAARPAGTLAAAMVVLVAVVATTELARGAVRPEFPFMEPAAPGWGGRLLVSAGVSVLYGGVTWLVFAATRPLEAPAAVRFLARNTLLVFLAHMPLYYLLQPVLRQAVPEPNLRAALMLLVCLPGLAALSDLLRAHERPRWRPAPRGHTPRRTPAAGSPGSPGSRPGRWSTGRPFARWPASRRTG
jgi:fucose 4-O-acetylase-like acetyltransferase